MSIIMLKVLILKALEKKNGTFLKIQGIGNTCEAISLYKFQQKLQQTLHNQRPMG